MSTSLLGRGAFSLAALGLLAALAPAASAQPVPDQYIVVLRANANARDVANAHGLAARSEYDGALNGFAAHVPAARLRALQNDPRVSYVEQDQVMAASEQTLPTGVDRSEGDQSSTAAGNGSGSISVGIAIIDTGIASHADLNLVGGINFANAGKKGNNKFADGNGHGTHVAGSAAAKDDANGVVGVAPGAPLTAVRVLDNDGSGFTSWVIAGIDWVRKNAAARGIKVANMSLGGGGSTALDSAVSDAIAAGVVFAVAAGNENQDAGNTSPARVGPAITVSCVADSDGAPGGLGGSFLRHNTTSTIPETDDTLATFSNWGSVVDIAAPGVNINSTWLAGGYRSISGTSMASPHVAGAAALYLSGNPGASTGAVRNALVEAGQAQGTANGFTGDRDAFPEPLLWLAGF
jgi:subtilisin family serine protease